MNYYKLKLAGVILGASTVILPPLCYKASSFYISVYDAGSKSLADARHKALNTIGLTEVEPEKAISDLIQEAATDYHLPVPLLTALVARESAHNSDAYSPKGAIGLAQIMAFNAARCGLQKKSKLWDDRNNIRCGAKILSEELKTYKGDLNKALIAYNGGPKAISGKYPESIRYAQDVINTFAQSSL